MRIKERIPVFLEKVDWPSLLTKVWKLDLSSEILNDLIIEINASKEEIKNYWLMYQDQRISQVLINLGLIPNMSGLWYYMEELEILKELGIPPREYLLWGHYIDRKNPESLRYSPIKDLSTEHIKNILKEEHTKREDYLSAFDSELILRGLNLNI